MTLRHITIKSRRIPVVTIQPSRKTFSGVGRPRSTGARKPCGRLVQPTKAETIAQARSTVLNQPHRNGSTDQRRHWAIGRLILDGKVTSNLFGPDELEQAAVRVAADHKRVKRVMDSRNALASTSGGQAPDFTREQGEEIRAQWSKVSRALAGAGERCKSAVELAILDNPTIDEKILNPWIVLTLPASLDALCILYGLEKRGRP